MGPIAGGEGAAMAPGERLAQARQSQNLTTAEVARQLKLSVWQVEALEAGLYRRLPGPIFVRGFIRNYARLVKLDSDELLRAARDSILLTPSRPEVPSSQNIPFPTRAASRWPAVGMAVIVVVVGALVGYEFYWNETDTAVTPPNKAAVPSVAVQAKPIPSPAKPEADRISQQIAGDPRVDLPGTGTAAAMARRDETQAAATSPLAELDRLPKPGERQVSLVFGGESWVEIRDRNERIIFSQLNRPGTRQFVFGLPPFSIVVGNAHDVQLTYDERPVDLAPYTKIDVARLILQ